MTSFLKSTNFAKAILSSTLQRVNVQAFEEPVHNNLKMKDIFYIIAAGQHAQCSYDLSNEDDKTLHNLHNKQMKYQTLS